MKTILKTSARLRLALDNNNMKQVDLAQKTGIPKSAISQYLSGKVNPKQDKIFLMAEALGVTEAWLMGVEEENTNSTTATPHPSLTPAKYKKFKVLGDIACVQPTEAIQQVEEFIETELNVHADYVLHCKGDSMINARIFNGDYVFIKEQTEVENGEIAAVEMDGTVTLKRFYRYDEYIELRAENPTYKPIIIHQTDFDSIRVLGKAVACQCFVDQII